MSSILAKVGIAALIALGAVGATVSTVSASEITVGLHQVRYDHHRQRICSPVLAVQKARAHGMRRAQVVNINQRRVVVEGLNRHGRDRVVFANVSGCPLIRR